MKLILKLISSLLANLILDLGVANITLASCTALNSNNGLNYYTATVTGINPPNFNPQAYSIGATIYSTTPSFIYTNSSSTGSKMTCSETWYESWIGNGAPTNKIYPTNINGLGIRISRPQGSFVLPFILPIGHLPNYAEYVTPIISSFPVFVELIKTGEITAGGSLSGIFAEAHENSPGGQLLVQVTYGSSVKIAPTIPTCSLATPSISVALDAQKSNSFTGLGSVSAAKVFQISLTCTGGSSGSSTNAYITFTDLNQPGNTSATLTLAGGSGAATGLGLQILNNGTPIGYGPDSNAPGNTNQWKVANIAQGVSSYVIPLGVRYIQTGSIVTPGTVTGRATFTMSYQ